MNHYTALRKRIAFFVKESVLTRGLGFTVNLQKNSDRDLKQSIVRMAELPLKNILNAAEPQTHIGTVQYKGENDKNLGAEFRQKVDQLSEVSNNSPVKTLKRKSDSLDISSHSTAKENFAGSDIDITKSPKKEKNRVFTVSVEGNIGSGKSTLLNYFASEPKVATFQEPIDQWTNYKSHNLLGKLYENPERWNFLFQSFVQLTRLKIHLDNPGPGIEAKLIERSFHNNRFCFMQNALESGHLHHAEFSVLAEYFDFFEKHTNIDIDLIVYLQTTPEVVFQRMKMRGRSEEASVPIEYIKSIHTCYENWLLHSKPQPPPAPVLIINGDVNLDTLFKECQMKLPIILGRKPFSESKVKSVVKLLGLDSNSES